MLAIYVMAFAVENYVSERNDYGCSTDKQYMNVLHGFCVLIWER
jgi:hypothetical protein